MTISGGSDDGGSDGEGGGGSGTGPRRTGRLPSLLAVLSFGLLRRAARRAAQTRLRPKARTKAERALDVLPQIREGEGEPDWDTPPRMPEGIEWRKVVAIAVVTLSVYAIGVMFAYLEWRVVAAPNLHPSVPAVIGQPRINLVIQQMFEVETRAYEENARAARRLESYGWVDRDAGTIHIPILRAMDEVSTSGDAGAPSGSPP